MHLDNHIDIFLAKQHSMRTIELKSLLADGFQSEEIFIIPCLHRHGAKPFLAEIDEFRQRKHGCSEIVDILKRSFVSGRMKMLP